MNLRKIFLLVGMLCAAIAFAVPAVASAGKLKDLEDGKEVTKTSKPIEITGTTGLSMLAGGISCTVHATLTPKDAETLEVTKFQITTTTCVGLGTFENCKVDTDELFLPWNTAVGNFDFTISEASLLSEISNCTNLNPMAQTLLILFGDITAKALNTSGTTITKTTEGIAGVELSGEGDGILSGLKEGFKVKVSGTLEVAGTDSPKCTYGFK